MTWATIDVVDVFMNFREVALGILRLFLFISPFGRHENINCKTLKLVAVPGLVLFLGVKEADAI
jgi:hypothetical protein